MPSMFISYRREESAGHAGRLYDNLKEHFGVRSVFMDVTGIRPGEDFANVLQNAVGSCEVVVVLIGRRWLTTATPDGARRLDDPADYVRLEIETALDRNLRVVPVLVEGVAMPHPGDLPLPLVDLARRQAHEIHDNRWKEDVARLIDALSQQGPRTVDERPEVLCEQRSCFYSSPEELTALYGERSEWAINRSVRGAKGPGTFQLTSLSLRFVGGNASFTTDLIDVLEVEEDRYLWRSWLKNRLERIGFVYEGTFDYSSKCYLCVTFYQGNDTRGVVLWGPEDQSFYGWTNRIKQAVAKRRTEAQRG